MGMACVMSIFQILSSSINLTVKWLLSKGVLNIEASGVVRSFREKNLTDNVSINAGYMVLNPEIFNYIEGDNTSFEIEPLEAVASIGELMSYEHKGFWQCMDTKSQKDELERLIAQKQAPWIVWDR